MYIDYQILFGKWSKPNYNTVVATYCHNIARDLDIQINNPDAELNLCYIDDVLEEFLKALEGNESRMDNFCIVPVTHNIKLGELRTSSTLLKITENQFKYSLEEEFDQAFIVLLVFLPEDKFSYNLK